MNYLRNAFGAVTQYYQDLPPINASTLTGAIDVIVVERPGPDGQPELACSPFHVRFGKWQILRPGEKGVTVMVNGKVIPYQMKIGDAGEAFFVFETDEDVPEELMTSPVLGPTKVGEVSNAQQQHTNAGRFGAQESSDEEQGVKSGLRHPRPSNSALTQEPSFLDLSEQKSHESSSEATGTSEEPYPSPPTSISTLNSVNEEGSPPSNTTEITDTTSKFRSVGPAVAALAKTAVSSAPGLAAEKAHQVGEVLRNIRRSSTRRDSKDAHSGSLGSRAAAAPPVEYKDHVVLDMGGYHQAEVTKESSENSIRESSSSATPTRHATKRREASDATAVPSDSPKRLTMDLLPHFRSDSQLTMAMESPTDAYLDVSPTKIPGLQPVPHRGASAPPELDLPSAQPSAEYSWEWGAFPTASPARGTFPLPDDNAFNRGPSKLRGSISKEGNLDLEVFDSEGKMTADPNNISVFWIKIDGKKHDFELSLCSHLLLDDDVEEDLRTFASHKIDLDKVLQQPEIVESQIITMKWGIKLITRRDSTRMVPALKRWVETLRTASNPVRPLSPASELDDISRPTTPGAPAPVPQERPSTWSRWFRRNNRPQSVIETSSSLLPISRPSINATISEPAQLPNASLSSSTLVTPRIPSPPPEPAKEPLKRYAKTLRLTSDQLKSLNLSKGANTITFALATTGIVACTAKIFVWDHTDHIVVSDIDGTITKSDALGHVFTMIGRDWTHLGVAKLYTDIARNGYKLMYLTSRAIGQADSTRDYLKGIKQNNYQLPEGPVIMSPDRLMASLHREVIMRKPEVFKMACLRDIQRLFGEASRVPFYAGFGNRITDALSYRSVNIPSARIFTIDSTGEVKMELLELAGYKSSYIHMTDLVDQMFPPVHRKWAAEFTDFNYWKDPIPEFDLPDLSPPSPALSAVSETSGRSRLSRLRNFSLGRQSFPTALQAQAAGEPAKVANTPPKGAVAGYHTHHRHRSTSPLARSDSEAISDGEESEADYHARARRRLSNESSMPGSLPSFEGNDSFEDDDEEAVEDENEDENAEGSVGDDHSIGDDAEDDPIFEDLANMERVPF